MTKTKKSLDPKKIASLMIDKKALDVKIINLNKLTTLTDYFIICTSESEPQTRAIFNHIKDELNKNNIKPWKTEGYEHLQWVIMDYINFVVHIFNKETREYYNFERLWGDAEITEIDK
tara:strand:+ start:888 stop:1241 length:354 start_codon:yes stop_codon:yes gene_type:complete